MERALEMAGTALDVELKHGPIRRAISGLLRRRGKNEPNEPTDLNDFREKAMEAALKNAVETIRVQELTVGQALRILGSGFTLDDLDKVDSTWEKRWSEGASRIGIDDEERRAWWARLLAEEIQQPGTFSLRAMAVMDTLSTKEAELFTRLCDYVWNPSNPVLILPTDESALWKPDFTQETLLESIGLFKFDSLGGFTWGTIDNKTETGTTQVQPTFLLMTYKNQSFLLEGPSGKSLRLRCGKLFLTDVGKEVYRLTTPNHPQPYCDEIVAEWKKSYTVHEVPIVPAQNS